jgi:hypothetical protein
MYNGSGLAAVIGAGTGLTGAIGVGAATGRLPNTGFPLVLAVLAACSLIVVGLALWRLSLRRGQS